MQSAHGQAPRGHSYAQSRPICVALGKPRLARAARHSHSIVNRQAPLRGRARRAPASNRLDTVKFTVVFDSPAQDSSAAIPGDDGSRQGMESQKCMF